MNDDTVSGMLCGATISTSPALYLHNQHHVTSHVTHQMPTLRKVQLQTKLKSYLPIQTFTILVFLLFQVPKHAYVCFSLKKNF